MSIGVEVSFWVPAFSSQGQYPEVEFLEQTVIPCFIFLETATLSSPAAAPRCTPATVYKGVGHGFIYK